MNPVTQNESAQAVKFLQDLIRIDTTNPPGNEIAACQYLASIFTKEHIEYQILESAPGRGNIIARIKGDGSLKPLLFTSHLDVVPCEKDKWAVDPFGGIIKDGFVWGRGAVDMKQLTAIELAVFLKAKRESLPLKRDIIFAAVADEEAGCRFGSEWLVDNHPELIRAEYAINEVGGFSLHIDNQVFYPIGVAERGLCWFKIKSTGQPGHGAMPHNKQALARLGFVAHVLGQNRLPFHKTAIVESFIKEIARRQSLPKNLILRAVLNKNLSGFILDKLFPDQDKARNFKNMLRNLATPTIFHAGQKENVMPTEAELTVDGRVLPGETVASFIAEIKGLIGDGFAIDIIRSEEPNQCDFNNVFFDTLKGALIAHDPGAIPVPFLIPGFTDARHYAKLGIKTYGFAPTKLPKGLDFGALYHGHNERIPVDSLGFGSRVLWDVLCASCLE